MLFEQPYLIYIGIVAQQEFKLAFGKIMNFGFRHLLFQTAHRGRREYDVADGGKAQDEEFDRFIHFGAPVIIVIAEGFRAFCVSSACVTKASCPVAV